MAETSPVVLITGASRGIGRAIAQRFARDGAKVGINYLQNIAAAEATTKDVQTLDGEPFLAAGDVSDAAAASGIVDTILKHKGV